MWRDRQRASWSTSQCADDPALRHAVLLPLTVGHPLWVKRDGLAMSALLPLHPRKPTFIVRGGMSQKCQEPTSYPFAMTTFRAPQGYVVWLG